MLASMKAQHKAEIDKAVEDEDYPRAHELKVKSTGEQDFLLPSDVPLLELWILPISIVLAQDSWPLTLSMFSSFSFGMCVLSLIHI